jgi:hypothetical protein
MAWPRSRKSIDDQEPILYSGVLFKRGYGRLLGRKTWKPRYFVLTRTTLRYFTFENGKLRGEIDLCRCSESALEVMPADLCKRGRSPTSIWRLALNVPKGRRLVLAPATEFEMNVWSQKIRRVLRALAAPQHAPLVESHPDKATEEIVQQEKVSVQAPDQAVATVTWKPTTTDFHNFVAQPRRSTIFRRRSIEGWSTAPGAQYRSTEHVEDGKRLQKELDELRAGLAVVASEAGTESVDEQDDVISNDAEEREEEALLKAIQEYSEAHGDHGSPVETESSVDAVSSSSSSLHDDPLADSEEQEGDRASIRMSLGPKNPVVYIKKEETTDKAAASETEVKVNEMVANDMVVSGPNDTWFATLRASWRAHRGEKKRHRTRASHRGNSFREQPQRLL